MKSTAKPLQWRHCGRDGVSNHQPRDCLFNCLFRRRLKNRPKFRVTGLCEGNSPVTGDFPAQRASNAENVSIWWRHHAMCTFGIRYWTHNLHVAHYRRQCLFSAHHIFRPVLHEGFMLLLDLLIRVKVAIRQRVLLFNTSFEKIEHLEEMQYEWFNH